MGEAADGLVGVVHGHGDAASVLEGEHLCVLRAATGRGPDKLHLRVSRAHKGQTQGHNGATEWFSNVR